MVAAEAAVLLELPVRDDVVLPLRLTASLSTAVQAMKEAQAARAKKMVWLDTPVSVRGRGVGSDSSSGV